MNNKILAEHFELLAKLMEIHGENSFRAKSYSSVAYKIDKSPQDILSQSEGQIRNISGIGEAMTQRIIEIKTTGKLPLLEEYIEKTPPGILDVMKIKGLGPKKVALLWNELGIESIGELEYACNENRLLTIKGFGQKTQSSILENIGFIKKNQGYFLYAELEVLNLEIYNLIKHKYPEAKIDSVGAFARQNIVLDILEFITDLPALAVKECMSTIELTWSNETNDYYLEGQIKDGPRVRFSIVANDNYYIRLFQLSASEVFKNKFEAQYTYPERAVSESEIFAYNDLNFIPTVLRENAEYLIKPVPELIQLSDVKGIIHAHSTYSDGINTLKEMSDACKTKGFQYFVISDHSQSAFYANGLNAERIAMQHKEVDQLNNGFKDFKVFKSIESDILFDGSLDYDNDVLATFDLVIASVHSILKMNEEKATSRLIKAIENPFTRILGHPTGRLLLSRNGYPIDYHKVIDACIANKVVIEINAHPRRLDLDWQWIQYALDKGVLFSVNPDAHSIEGIGLVKYGVLAAQKGGLTASANLSSFNLDAFEHFLKYYKS